MQSKRKGLRGRIVWLIIPLSIFGFLGGVLYLFVGRLWLEQNPGPFDRKLYEAVVQEMRSRPLKADEETTFWLDDFSNPKSLRSIDPEFFPRLGTGRGHVWAMKTATGLKVAIETRDLGHAGEYGFCYTDEPLTPTPDDRGWCCYVKVPGVLNQAWPAKKIDEHWWSVYNGNN